METLSSILDSLAATPTKSASRTIASKITPVYALPHHFTLQCECSGKPITEFEFRALAALSNKWFAKHCTQCDSRECIFIKNHKFFADLDGKLRAMFGETMPDRDAFVLAVQRLVR